MQKIEAAHVLAAAAYCLSHPEVRSHSKKYGVEIDGTWFTPRDLLKKASAEAGAPLLDAYLSQYDASWRERLKLLGFIVHERSVGRSPEHDSHPHEVLSLPSSMPERILAEHVRDAARYWCKGGGYKGFRHVVRYQVWVDVDLNGQAEPFPLKAIVALASTYSGQRPLNSKDISVAPGGKWVRRLCELGFLVSGF